MTSSDKIEALKTRIAGLQEQLRTESKSAFTEGSKDFFERYPNLDSFGWTQYTPYFNDGEPCEFQVRADNDWDLRINGERPGESDQWEYIPGTYEKTHIAHPELHDVADELSEFIYAIPEEAMKSMFDDHVTVTVHRSGEVETEYYEHE